MTENKETTALPVYAVLGATGGIGAALCRQRAPRRARLVIGAPEEVASAIAWLLDSANSWITGQVIGVDGGLASVRPR